MTLFVQGLDVKGLILPEAMRRLFARVHMPCPSGELQGPCQDFVNIYTCVFMPHPKTQAPALGPS